jgi:mannose-6-phosphate isomerase-like protein (cupin superfamily)
MSRLTEFYRGTGTDVEVRTLEQLWAYTDEQLEGLHDFIQWMFPLRTPSRFNSRAPLMTDADIAEFRAEPKLRANLLRSFEVFLRFLGLRRERGRVVKRDDFEQRGVFHGPDHNWLRITRVLTSTRLLGLEAESHAFFEFLRSERDSGRSGITAESFRYWENAVPKLAPLQYQVVDFAEIEGVPCPCGLARRAFTDVAEFPATVHVTEISADAKRHYHRWLTETYYILECGADARMELDGHEIPVKPGLCVLIPPGVRHRALGRMKVLILVLPKFDPEDEWFD